MTRCTIGCDPPTRLAGFARCTDAEDYFELLEVTFDQEVLAVNRLHILKRFAADVAAIDAERGPAGDEDDPGGRLDAYRAALEAAHDTFLTSGPLDHRLFKVLADHAPEPARIVAVDALTAPGGEEP
jgi:nitrogenase-stabilizing/protective protein